MKAATIVPLPPTGTEISGPNNPDLVFEEANISEPNGSYLKNLSNVGWKAAYQVQLKNKTNKAIKITSLNVKSIDEGKPGSNVYIANFSANGKVSPKLPLILQPFSDTQINIPLRRDKAYPEGNGITPKITTSYTYEVNQNWNRQVNLAAQ